MSFRLKNTSIIDYMAGTRYEPAMRQRIEQAAKPKPTRAPSPVARFPLANQPSVGHHLKAVADCDSPSAFKRLNGVLRQHRAKLTALGIAPSKIDREIDTLA